MEDPASNDMFTIVFNHEQVLKKQWQIRCIYMHIYRNILLYVYALETDANL